jgi:hypothetical protein
MFTPGGQLDLHNVAAFGGGKVEVVHRIRHLPRSPTRC